MKRLLGSILAATCAIYIFDPPLAQSQTPIAYMLAQIDTPMWAPLDINDKGDVLFERQLAESSPPVPIVLNRNGKESAPFECPGTTNDTAGYAMNGKREVVGSCNGNVPVAFIVNMNNGQFQFLNAPGAVANWALGINDSGDVVGFYSIPVEPPFCCFLPIRHLHSYFWEKKTGQYITIPNHPGAEETGGWTQIRGLNDKRQMIGHYTDNNGARRGGEFIYENGVFTDLDMRVEAFNNLSQVLGFNQANQVTLFDDGKYFAIVLPLPAHAPRPDGAPVGTASVHHIGGLNDSGQFVGSYSRITAWEPEPNPFRGPFRIAGIETVNFIASPTPTPKGKKK